MNRDEAKAILLLYRPGTADADDPQIAEALALAGRDTDLGRWLKEHCARQAKLRGTFRQITAPPGLKEQIISEQPPRENVVPLWRREITLTPALAMAAVLLITGVLAMVWFANQPGKNDTLAAFQDQMAGVALRNYGMDLTTNDPVQIRSFLAQNQAPADFFLPEALKQARLVGCAVEGWRDTRVSMICFRTDHAAPNASTDLWLFVVDRTSVKKSTVGPDPQFAKVNELITATWVQGDKLYFLGTVGDQKTIQHYL